MLVVRSVGREREGGERGKGEEFPPAAVGGGESVHGLGGLGQRDSMTQNTR